LRGGELLAAEIGRAAQTGARLHYQCRTAIGCTGDDADVVATRLRTAGLPQLRKNHQMELSQSAQKLTPRFRAWSKPACSHFDRGGVGDPCVQVRLLRQRDRPRWFSRTSRA